MQDYHAYPKKTRRAERIAWAGNLPHIIAPNTGKATDACIFASVLTYSQYAFVKAYMNKKQLDQSTCSDV